MNTQREPDNPALIVSGLNTTFKGSTGWVQAVKNVSFAVPRGRTVGLVGESGSGKSATCMSIVRLHSRRNAPVISGRVMFKGQDLVSLSERQMRKVRGTGIAMVLQDPVTSLNPTMTIGRQLAEGIRQAGDLDREDMKRACAEQLHRVGIPGATSRLDQYPHEMSGGMRQRVAIAIALACEPELLIADEPTTALDATIQDQILRPLQNLQATLGFSMIFVSHDLGVVGGMCDEVCVMHNGEIVEAGETIGVLKSPTHPYTRQLVRSASIVGAAGVEGSNG